MEKTLIIIIVASLALITFQTIQILRLKKVIRWYESWGRKYLEKYRDQAEKEKKNSIGI